MSERRTRTSAMNQLDLFPVRSENQPVLAHDLPKAQAGYLDGRESVRAARILQQLHEMPGRTGRSVLFVMVVNLENRGVVARAENRSHPGRKVEQQVDPDREIRGNDMSRIQL